MDAELYKATTRPLSLAHLFCFTSFFFHMLVNAAVCGLPCGHSWTRHVVAIEWLTARRRGEQTNNEKRKESRDNDFSFLWKTSFIGNRYCARKKEDTGCDAEGNGGVIILHRQSL